MLTAELRLANSNGLHLRPATVLVQKATEFRSQIRVANLDGDPTREVDAKSILAVLGLGAEDHARIRVRAEGCDEGEAVAALAEAVREGLGESSARRRLTRRQDEVLKLVASGFSRKEIAARLGLSEHTVRNHLTRLYAVLGVHDSAHAVMSAVRAGLLKS